jgi:hypothetical protein
MDPLQNEQPQSDGRKNRSNIKWNYLLPAIFVAVILVIVVPRLINTAKPSTFSIDNGILKIDSEFGGNVTVSEITFLELTGFAPDPVSHSPGSQLGKLVKGTFNLADGSSAKMFADISKPPFIHFRTAGTEYYIGGSDSDITKSLYDELAGMVQK